MLAQDVDVNAYFIRMQKEEDGNKETEDRLAILNENTALGYDLVASFREMAEQYDGISGKCDVGSIPKMLDNGYELAEAPAHVGSLTLPRFFLLNIPMIRIADNHERQFARERASPMLHHRKSQDEYIQSRRLELFEQGIKL